MRAALDICLPYGMVCRFSENAAKPLFGETISQDTYVNEEVLQRYTW